MSGSIGVFGFAVVLGYFILPILITKETVRIFLSKTTDSEASRRDWILKFMTDFMTRHLNFITPNVVSWIGFALVFLLVYLFQSEAHFALVFIVALLAGFTDMLDGSLARNSKRVTRLGVVLDVTRDFLLVIVLSFYLIRMNVLPEDLFFWFLVGYIYLGVIRNLEFKFSSGKTFSLQEDYKFVLDRIRLFLYIVGILFFLLIPLVADFRSLGETFIVTSIVITWVSVFFHSAHLKILRDERRENLLKN